MMRIGLFLATNLAVLFVLNSLLLSKGMAKSSRWPITRPPKDVPQTVE